MPVTSVYQKDKTFGARLNLSPFECLKIEKHSGGADTLAFISNKYDALTQVLSRLIS